MYRLNLKNQKDVLKHTNWGDYREIYWNNGAHGETWRGTVHPSPGDFWYSEIEVDLGRGDKRLLSISYIYTLY